MDGPSTGNSCIGNRLKMITCQRGAEERKQLEEEEIQEPKCGIM